MQSKERSARAKKHENLTRTQRIGGAVVVAVVVVMMMMVVGPILMSLPYSTARRSYSYHRICKLYIMAQHIGAWVYVLYARV